MPEKTRHIGLSLGADICWPICYEALLNELDLAISIDGTTQRFEVERVAIEPFDLRQPVRIRDHQDLAHPQLSRAGGFDHNFEVRGHAGSLRPAGGLVAPDTGLKLTVDTTQPGLQFYAGQHLAAPFEPGLGVCLEAQQHPDAPNQPDLPGGELHPGQVWRQRTVYRFERTE